MKNKILKYIAAASAVVVFLLAGCFLPGYIVGKNGEAENDRVMIVPEKFYSKNLEFLKKTSEKLTETQRLQLATGEWASEISEADTEDMNLSQYEIVNIAVGEINKRYQEGKCDFNLESGFSNWFSWTCIPMKAIDKTFNTYCVYFWEIVFVRYDNSDIHKVRIFENGTIISIE